MDFDPSKENIQPLRRGRNVSQLGVALQAQTDMDHQRELVHQKEEFERLIRTYNGDDPLHNWFNYISWVEQSYPKQGHEGNLIPLLEHCLKLFEHDVRYREDRRLCKLFIKYIDQQQTPAELYHMMYSQEICRTCPDMYKAWAYYYEAAGDFQNAHRVFECGKREFAQPFEELQMAHEQLVLAAGRHMLYGPNETDLTEKRQALTSLQTYKPGQVDSLRNPSNFQHVTTGTALPHRFNNGSIPIYEDKGEEIRGAEAAPISIVSAAKRQEVSKENTLQPGPWTTVTVKNNPNICRRNTPHFTVHEDIDDNRSNLKLENFVSATSENYSDWIVSLTIPEPKSDTVITMYPKDKVYSEINTEYSIEELRAVRCRSSKRMSSEVIPSGHSMMQDTSMHICRSIDVNKNEQSSYQNISRQAEQKAKHFSPVETYRNIGQPLGSEEDHGLELPFTQIARRSPPHDISQPANSSLNYLNFDLWEEPEDELNCQHSDANVMPKFSAPKFSIYEQSNVAAQEHLQPKGSAMKTPFKDLNAEELAETGSRGGMDVAAAAAPVDSAKRLAVYDEDSNSSYAEPGNFGDLSCNTQMFVFNLNAMQVSTPQNKQDYGVKLAEDPAKIAPKQLFAETLKNDDEKYKLSTILEETKSYGQTSSSSSSNATTKSSLFGSHIKQNNMPIILEEHHNYLAENLMANAALRSSSLGDLMDFGQHSPSVAGVERISTVTHRPTSVVSTPAKVVPLNCVPSDPFKQSLINQLLERVNFPGPHTQGYSCLNNIPKLTVRKESIGIGPDRYVIEKQLGKGTFGTVFRGIDVRTGNTVAVKSQKPPNRWEFYICRELRSRLVDHPLRERFMNVTIGYFSDQWSVLVSEFMPCGSLLDVANMVKQKSGRSMKESLCIHFCLEMLKVVQAMHEVKIIHADLKPDNFLVQLLPNDIIGLQLIDFGCSIDMSLFPLGASFTRKVTTEDFVCCEMIDNKPWNYHTDLFCIAATAHVLLFEKYIQLQKKDGHWSISNRLPRYARLDLWNMFFSTLLNQQNGPANSESLQAMLEDSLNHKFDDHHNEMRYLTNILKNR